MIVHHIEELKFTFGLPNIWATSSPVYLLGKLGVVLFFVLSGFLITFLLLEEEQRTGIRVGRFYMRRVLRIWPLYYFTVGLALFVLPFLAFFAWPGYGIAVVHNQLPLKTVLYATLFANLVTAFVGVVPFATQAWSIGAEEQFYLFWPILMKRARNKARAMVALIALYSLGRVVLSAELAGHGPWLSGAREVYSLFNFDFMIIGGLAGVALHQKSRWLSLLVNRPAFYLTLTATVVLISTGVVLPRLNAEAYSVLFAVLILNFAVNRRIGWSLESGLLRYLGKISYGLYMLHPLAIVASIRILGAIGWTQDAILYPTCLLGAVALASISYRFLESPFLRLKSRFTDVVSGEAARAVSA